MDRITLSSAGLDGVQVPHPSNIGVPFSVPRDLPPVDADRLAARPSMNLVSTQHALLACLAPDHSGLEANVLRFDDPLQAARTCSTFPTDE